MVDVSAKAPSQRSATAAATVALGRAAFEALTAAGGGGGGGGLTSAKGDVLGVARVAGVLAAKRTAELIPLCHSLALTHVGVDFELAEAPDQVGFVAETAETPVDARPGAPAQIPPSLRPQPQGVADGRGRFGRRCG